MSYSSRPPRPQYHQQQHQQQGGQQGGQQPWVAMGLPPPKSGHFVGGSRPPGGGFAKFQHLAGPTQGVVYDGKRMRKAVQRRAIDPQANILAFLDRFPYNSPRAIYPDPSYLLSYEPPMTWKRDIASVPTKFIRTSVNKIKCPVNVVVWTPEGRRLLTGSTSGEFTLWNGTTFNFETIMQSHDGAIRAMEWSHNEKWMISADQVGDVKYWQPNLNNVKVVQAHKEPIRALTWSPSDTKFASCSDDSTIKIWDFADAREERTMTGHGWDVRCIDWHPHKALLVSGGKDNLIKLWDVKTGKELSTLHGFKNTIQALTWNRNGNHLLAGSRDQLIRMYDIRMMKECCTFKGHKKEVTALEWHPIHERLFASGGSEGALYYWSSTDPDMIDGMDQAHDASVWSLSWHPLGHMLVSGSNDFSTRFWTRPRPIDESADGATRSMTADPSSRFQDASIPGFREDQKPDLFKFGSNPSAATMWRPSGQMPFGPSSLPPMRPQPSSAQGQGGYGGYNYQQSSSSYQRPQYNQHQQQQSGGYNHRPHHQQQGQGYQRHGGQQQQGYRPYQQRQQHRSHPYNQNNQNHQQ